MNKTDRIIELKKLLDSNLITQSDFDRLKVQIFEEQNFSKSENEVVDNSLKKINIKSSKNSSDKISVDKSKNSYSQDKSTKYIVFGVIVITIFIVILINKRQNNDDNVKKGNSKAIIDSTKMIEVDREAEPLIESAKIDTTTINLKKYIGSFTTQTDLFDSKFINYELNRILGSEFNNYKDFVNGSSSGQIIRKGDLIYGDIFIRSVGGYESIFFINLKDKKMHLFWLNDSIGSSSNCKIYGDKPIPENVIDIILEEMNTKWGHVAKFSSIDSEIYIEFN